MGDPVIASLITAGITVIGFLLQGWYFAGRLEKLRQSGAERLAEKVEELKVGSAGRTRRLELALEAFAKHQDNHHNALTRLWNAVSIAQSAANGMVQDSGTKQVSVLISRTTKFLQDISVFLEEAKTAPSNVYLNRDDVGHVVEIQRALVRLFVALDLDSGPDPNYQEKLRARLAELNTKVAAFEARVRAEVVPNE